MKYIHPSNMLQKICANTGWLGVKIWHAFAYYRLRGRWPNFLQPKDLSEHILSAMNKKSFEGFAYYADKVKVREYIQSKGLGDTLLSVYGVWNRAEDVDFDSLPDKFALKPNNGSGGHYFCKDKSKINKVLVINQLNAALDQVKKDIAFKFERHYACIEPKIYCEELIDTGSDAWPVDYKFTCVRGQIADIFVATERESGTTKYCTFDTNWEVLPYTKNEYMPSVIPVRPKLLHRMIEIAKLLSSDFDFVRVDLYEYRGKVYFSELTFSPWGGYMFSYNDYGIQEIGKLFY